MIKGTLMNETHPRGANPRLRSRPVGLCTILVLCLSLASATSDATPAESPTRSYAPDAARTLHVGFEQTATSTHPPVSPRREEKLGYGPGALGFGLRLGADSHLAYPPSVLPEEEGSIQFWLRLDRPEPFRPSTPSVLIRAHSEDAELSLRLDSQLRLRFEIREGTNRASILTRPVPNLFDRLSHVYLAWRNRSLLSLYVDGHHFGASPAPGVALHPGDLSLLEIAPGVPCTLDELQISGETSQLAYRARRDYLRSVPLRDLRIDPAPFSLPAEQNLVVGQRKQIGVRGILSNKNEVELLIFGGAGNYSIEGWDARESIVFSSAHPEIARVDEHGGVIGLRPGVCRITARFGDLETGSVFKVLSDRLPDLSIRFIEPASGNSGPTTRGAQETMTTYAEIVNQGTIPCPSFRYEWQLIADDRGRAPNALDAEPLKRHSSIFPRPLPPGARAVVELRFPNPEQPFSIKLTVDPDGEIEELSQLNNYRSSWSQARPVRLSYPESLRAEFRNRFTLAGSLGLEDYLYAHVSFLNQLLARAAYHPITPDGVRVRLNVTSSRSDDDERDVFAAHTSYDFVSRHGEFVVGSSWVRPEESSRFRYDLIHELCHAYLGLPDTLCSAVRRRCVFVQGPDGVPAAHPDRLAGLAISPVDGEEFVYYGSANGPEGSVGCDLPESTSPTQGKTTLGNLMGSFYPRLSSSLAGHVDRYREVDRPDATDSFTRHIPQRNRILIQDIDSAPLPGARIRIFQQTPGAGGCFSSYFPDNPKFRGHSGPDGMWVFPKKTSPAWDDPETEAFDGEVTLINPFSTVGRPLPLTPTIRTVNSIFLVEIAIGNRVVYHFIDLDQFHLAYYTGNGLQGTLYIRTEIDSAQAAYAPHFETRPFAPPPPLKTTNRPPEARIDAVPESALDSDVPITLTATGSRDPEGAPILGHVWTLTDDQGRTRRSFRPQVSLQLSNSGDTTVELVVSDGVLLSQPTRIVLKPGS